MIVYRRKPSVLLILAFLSVCVGCRQSSKENGDSPISIELTSTAFQKEMTIPKQYTGDGADHSPPLHWAEPPSDTMNGNKRMARRWRKADIVAATLLLPKIQELPKH